MKNDTIIFAMNKKKSFASQFENELCGFLMLLIFVLRLMRKFMMITIIMNNHFT